MSDTVVNVQKNGRLAQLVELLPYKQAVTGSSPVPSIFLFTPAFFELWRRDLPTPPAAPLLGAAFHASIS